MTPTQKVAFARNKIKADLTRANGDAPANQPAKPRRV
jgi:hypothetical protein